MNAPAIDLEYSPAGRDADEYQWAEFNLPSDLMAESSAEAANAAVLAPAPGADPG